MRRALALALVAILTLPALADARPSRTTKLERAVRTLQRQLREERQERRALQRQVDYLQVVQNCQLWLPVTPTLASIPESTPLGPSFYLASPNPGTGSSAYWLSYATGDCLDQVDAFDPDNP